MREVSKKIHEKLKSMWKISRLKKLIITLLVLLVIVSLLFVTGSIIKKLGQEEPISKQKTDEKENYCDHKSDWDKCDGKTIKIVGKRPEFAGQHPGVRWSIWKNQSYLDTESKGEIILISEEEINCSDEMTVIGELNTDVWPCDSDGVGKSSYCGSSITVESWECHQ